MRGERELHHHTYLFIQPVRLNVHQQLFQERRALRCQFSAEGGRKERHQSRETNCAVPTNLALTVLGFFFRRMDFCGAYPSMRSIHSRRSSAERA